MSTHGFAIATTLMGLLMGLPGLAAAQMFTESANIALAIPNTNANGDPTSGTRNLGGDALAILDTDDDGWLDIAIVPGGAPYFQVIKNVGGLVATSTRLPANYVGVVGDTLRNTPTGLGMHDFNHDGLMDLYLTNQGPGNPGLRNPRPPFDLSPSNIAPGNSSSPLYRVALSQGDGTFGNAGLSGLNANGDGNTRAAVFADFDGDGNTDLVMSNAPYFGIWWRSSSKPNQLRMGLPDGTFGPDVLQSSVVNDPTGALWRDELGRANTDYKGIVVRDFDRDGKPDLILSAFADIWDNVQNPPIWTQDPAGALVDVNSDGLPDGGYQGDWKRGILVLRNVSTPGTVAFEDVSATATDNALGLTDQMHTYVTVPADIDGDGDLDLLCSGPRLFFAHNSLLYETDRVRVYRNDSLPGSIVFTNVTATSGIDFMNDDAALGAFVPGVYPVVLPGYMLDGGDLVLTPLLSAAAALDVDNDGDVDWVAIDRQLTSRNPLNNAEFAHWLFLNDGTGHFSAVQPADHGMIHTARDLSYGDLNGDGRLDIVSVNGSGGGQTVDDATYVWANNIQNDNHYVFIEVQLPGDPFGLGTRVTVYDAGTTNVVGYDEMRTDFAYRSKRPALLHFGLGTLTSVDVRLEAPDGQTILHQGLGVDTTHTLNLTTPTTTSTTTPTTTTTTTSTSSTTTSTLAPVLISARRFSMRDRTTPPEPVRRRIRLNSSTKTWPANRIVMPAPGGAADPTLHGLTVHVYNSAGLTTDHVTVTLPATSWKLIGTASTPKAYKFSLPKGVGGPISRMTIRPDALSLQGGKETWGYTLDEPQQGMVAFRVVLADTGGWCADVPPRPSAQPQDAVDKFNGLRNGAPPVSCPAYP